MKTIYAEITKKKSLRKVQISWNALKEEWAHLASSGLEKVNCPKAVAVCKFKRSLQKTAPLQEKFSTWRINQDILLAAPSKPWGWRDKQAMTEKIRKSG